MPKRVIATRERYRRRRRLLSIREAFASKAPAAAETPDPVQTDNPLAADIDILKDTIARQRADFENFRRRTLKERDQLQDSAREQLLTTLLPVLDNFDRAMGTTTNEAAILMQGFEMISMQLKKTLEDEGLSRISSLRRPFNPSEHDALMTEERDDVPENYVAEELAPGYRFKDRVIRAAMVKVAKKNPT